MTKTLLTLCLLVCACDQQAAREREVRNQQQRTLDSIYRSIFVMDMRGPKPICHIMTDAGYSWATDTYVPCRLLTGRQILVIEDTRNYTKIAE